MDVVRASDLIINNVKPIAFPVEAHHSKPMIFAVRPILPTGPKGQILPPTYWVASSPVRFVLPYTFDGLGWSVSTHGPFFVPSKTGSVQ